MCISYRTHGNYDIRPSAICSLLRAYGKFIVNDIEWEWQCRMSPGIDLERFSFTLTYYTLLFHRNLVMIN